MVNKTATEIMKQTEKKENSLKVGEERRINSSESSDMALFWSKDLFLSSSARAMWDSLKAGVADIDHALLQSCS